MPRDLSYILLLFVLFVVPRFLQRYRLPGAVTALALGVGATALGLFQHDETIALMATFGIVALFLFAGLDVDLEALRPDARVLVQHLAIWAATLALLATAATWLFGLAVREASLVALALLTPSTGFILDSLDLFGLSDSEKKWTKSKAIASELLALIVMFIALQSTSAQQLGLSVFALLALVVMLPPVFRWFASRIAPFAPRSEFAFLLMVAVVAASATRRLGVYYLVGAFVVGLAARQFRARLPAMSSERMLGAVEAFASFFVPFYFFHAGAYINPEDMNWTVLLTGLALLVTCVGLRLGEVTLHRWAALREPPKKSLRIGVALLPTLVFTLVIVDILRNRPGVTPGLLGALVLYTTLITLLPGLILRVPAIDYTALHLDPIAPPADAGVLGSAPEWRGGSSVAPELTPAPAREPELSVPARKVD
ncbi:MAG TPA: cation:proton antiporter [Gemmatimonadales bacterium]|nr:cation:proton antiporter [Gemmatimonadales bacterium]